MTAPSWGAKGEKKHYICIHKEKAQKNMESPLCCSATPGDKDCPGVWLIDPGSLHWCKLIFPLPTGTSYK